MSNENKIVAKDIYEFLDRRVVGQKHAKRTLATAGFLHAAKTLYVKNKEAYGVHVKPIRSSNVLLMGHSGSGKTYLVQTLAECLGTPYLEINARSLSNEGYKGTSITEQVETLYNSTPSSVKDNLKYAIVFLDEFDKIAANGSTLSSWNLSLQHSLLKVIEGSDLCFSDKKGTLNTSSMLFVLGGNFREIREVIRTPKKIGFQNSTEDEVPRSMHQQLIQAGIIQEIVGRISLVSEVLDLTRNELRQILNEAEMSIYERYQSLYRDVLGKELVLSKDQIKNILDKCEEKGMGARGLHSALDELLSKSLMKESITVNLDLSHIPNYEVY